MPLVPIEKLKAWAETVDATYRIPIVAFLTEAETKVAAEVDAAKKCLADYGYKVIETSHHEYKEL